MISACDITKSYGEVTVLRGVSLQVARAEVVAITGLSGAGKSTLLQILGTLDSADSGQIEIAGINPFSLSANALANFRNRHIGFIFQFHHLLPEFTVLDNVCMPGYIGKVKHSLLHDRARQLLKILGISDLEAKKPSRLSGGEQQRVAVARALVQQPSVVLADEPSGNLDSKNAQALHDLFFTLRNELGQTFVLVTHNQQLAEMSDRSLEMADGLIVREVSNIPHANNLNA